MSIFNKFDVLSGDASSDHRYLSQKNSKSQKSSFQKKIVKEWRILQHHLPDSIFVRAYENRIDLLRAVIVGPAGTPYQDGLYFFDLAFPSDYPNRPPSVSYNSFGLRINPNLYENGTVCLSLLNTWPGRDCEKWNPKVSNVLQILLSIQALVLNAEPYYNEPGFGKIGSWPDKSMAYNAKVFALSLKTMLFLLRQPPSNFKSLVASHFRERAKAIVSACNAYANGLSYYSPGMKTYVSQEDKDLIDELHTKLVVAFTKNGTPPCSILHSEEDRSPVNTPSVFPERVIRGKGELVNWKTGCLVFVFVFIVVFIFVFVVRKN